MTSAGNKLFTVFGGGGLPYLLNQNLLLASQYEPGGWLYDNHSRASTATRTNSSGLIESVAIDVPRLQHDSAGNPLGYLHEPQATNFITESADISTWTNQGTTVGAGGTGKDDNACQRITEDTSFLSHLVYKSDALATGSVCIWCDAKLNEGSRYLQLRPAGIGMGKAFASFDLAGESVHTTGGTEYVSSGIEDIGDGFYRCWMVANYASAPTGMAIAFSNDGTEQPAYLGSTGNSFDVWHAQAEAGSQPTSHIPTTGAAATRQADLLDRHALGRTLTEGTLYAWFAHYNESPDPSKAPIIGLFESEATYTVGSASIDGEFAGNYVLDALVRDASSLQYRKTSAALTSGQFYKAALAFAAGDCRAALDGTLLGAGSGSEAVPAVTSMSIFRQGGDGAGGSNYPMSSPAILREFRVAPRRMSDAELQTLTS